MADVDAAFFNLVRFFFLVSEAALIPVVLVGLFLTRVDSLVSCFFRVFFLATLFGGVVLIAFACFWFFLVREDRAL